jgi:hypothetical protein
VNRVPSRRCQQGYLIEIPLTLSIFLLALALILPRFSPIWQKVLLSFATVPTLFCLYYLIVVPGWRPGMSLRGRALGRLVLFFGCAAATIAALAAFILLKA